MPRVTVTVPDKTAQPYRFPLDRECVTLGRGIENDIVIDCGSVSVKHAEMLRVSGGYVLRDHGSTNGITLDDERRAEISLHSGLSVKLGDVPFDFQLMDEELEVLAREKRKAEEPVVREPEMSPPKLPPLKEKPPRAVPLPKIRSGSDARAVLLLVMLALAAFFSGMTVRFYKETGGSLISAMMGHHPPTVNPPVKTLPAVPVISPAPVIPAVPVTPAVPETSGTTPAPVTPDP